MDKAEQTRRWETAQEHYNAAQQLLASGLYRACVSRSYYACFQAMWVAVGDPPLGWWKHAGLWQFFCHGQWTVPPLLPTTLASLYQRLLTLYQMRLDADYRALSISQVQAQEAVDTATQVFDVIKQHKTF
jgi:uncharacterized protein (UPF0332 family)